MRKIEELALMAIIYAISALLAVMLMAYLLVSLLIPEKLS